MNSDDAIIIALPADPGSTGEAAHWWRVVGGHITERGGGLARFHNGPGGIDPAQVAHIMGLAPVELCLLHQLPMPAMPEKQAVAVAQRMIAGESPTGEEVLHIVASAGDDLEAGHRAFASVPAAMMGQWQQLLASHGMVMQSIVPAALLVDPGETTVPVRAQIGAATIIRSGWTALPDEPALVAALCADDAAMVSLTAAQVEQALVTACNAPPAELLSGAWATRRSFTLSGQNWTGVWRVAAALALVSLLIPLAMIARLHASANALDDETIAMAGRIGANAATAEAAVTAADQKLAQLGTGPALVTTPITALVQAMEAAPTVNLDSLSWRGDGILSVTLGGPRNEDINPVLELIQRAGYRITAQPRAGTDGRALADITIRSGP